MRKILTSLFVLFLACSVVAQKAKMRDVFKQMPDTIVPYLSESNRLDFIDFIDSDMAAEVTNQLGGKSRMTQLDDNYAALSLNEAFSIELGLLDIQEPVDSISQVVCMVQTYGSDIKESTVAFYTVGWEKLPANKFLSLPPYMFRATLDMQQPALIMTPVFKLDAPANEEQEVIEKPSKSLKWENTFINEY